MVRTHLEETERHGRCRTQPYADLEQKHTDGGGRFTLTCRWHSSSRWMKNVTEPETTALVRAFVDAALITQKGRPPLDAG
ncbi:hypothetical protein NKH18_51535 [Streptomyces sp. M10(2022)]